MTSIMGTKDLLKYLDPFKITVTLSFSTSPFPTHNPEDPGQG